MRTFAWTSLVRVIIILASRVYMTNFQSDALYNFLNLNNPATNAVNTCMKELESIQSGNQVEFENINMKLDSLLSGNTAVTILVPNTTLIPTTGSSSNSLVTGNNVRLITD